MQVQIPQRALGSRLSQIASIGAGNEGAKPFFPTTESSKQDEEYFKLLDVCASHTSVTILSSTNSKSLRFLAEEK